METQIVIFDLNDEHFGVDINDVESIIKIQTITRMPQTLPFVEGIINLRGKVLPVVDLRRRFNLPSQSETKDTRIVVASLNGFETGMVVDGVSEVLTIQDTDIEPTPQIVTTVDSEFITGIAKLENRLIILLDLNSILTTPKKMALQALPTVV